MRFATTLFTATALLTSVSAINILGLINLNPNILRPGNSLINLNVLADILSPQQCTGTAVLGVQANIQLLSVVSVCACVEVINTPRTQTVCPPCVKNASPLCALSTGTCGCQCDIGYYAGTVNGTEACIPATKCSLPNTLISLATGKAQCVCARGFIDDLEGGCMSACLVI